MEQLYLLEILIDKVMVYAIDEADNGADKQLIVKGNFGPKVQFIFKEGQLSPSEDQDEIVECDAHGHRKWARTLRVGQSFLFPSYPDTMLQTLSKFPLEIEVWNDDETEVNIFVGVGTMKWDSEFYEYLKDSTDSGKIYEPFAVKQVVPLKAECCCKQAGEVVFFLRLTALGPTITTEFQQLTSNPEQFCFRTNKAPSMFQCKRVEGDDPNFVMVGTIYETTTLEDPDIIANANRKIEICTELQSCGHGEKRFDERCHHDAPGKAKRSNTIDKIRMGDITGPCGNTNCPLAHRIKNYIRNLDAYKKETQGALPGTKINTGNDCGACSCKNERWHRDACIAGMNDGKTQEKSVCKACGGTAESGETKVNTGVTPKQSNINYLISTTRLPPEEMRSLFGKIFIVNNLTTEDNYGTSRNQAPVSQAATLGCHFGRSELTSVNTQLKNINSAPNIRAENRVSSRSFGYTNAWVYNAEVKETSTRQINNFCTDIPEDSNCRCNPPIPSGACKTFDCDCITETLNIAARKAHKPFCPLYKHKPNCPVMMQDEEEKNEFEEDEPEPLPYGLPPIQLGPCPVLGRPCTVPDGFARMYKTAAVPAQMPTYSDAGKICCSKEYERIKKAVREYMKCQKDDFKCITKYNVDTEKRCCDKEQVLLALMGKTCCGSHKMAIQEQYEDQEKK